MGQVEGRGHLHQRRGQPFVLPVDNNRHAGSPKLPEPGFEQQYIYVIYESTSECGRIVI